MRNRYNSRRGCSCQRCRNCKELPVMPKNPELANAYVPYQYVDDLLCPMESLEHGTTFPELVSPYSSGESQCIISYLKNTKTCEEDDSCE